MTEILRVEALRKSYDGFLAVNGVSFSVAKGELKALIGPNGAGKSTCFNMLMGQLRPTAGQVFLDGENITGRKPREIWRKGVGRTFQITGTYQSMTVIENLQKGNREGWVCSACTCICTCIWQSHGIRI